MITKIEVTGYRSLTGLTLPVQPGLNVLVGPNGGGKTNILSFFEFLTQLVSSQVDEAISAHGGVGRVFSRTSSDDFCRSLTACIRGVITFPNRNLRPVKIWYTWEFTIESSETFDEIYYTSQHLYMDTQSEPRDPNNSDLIVSFNKQSDNGGGVSVRKLIISRLQYFFESFGFSESGKYIPFKDADRLMTLFAKNTDFRRESLVSGFPAHIAPFQAIANDIGGGKIYNFVPEVCKQQDDSSRPPVIERNGSGLSSTLYSLDKPARPARGIRRRSVVRSNAQALAKIREYVALISDAISGVSARRNPMDNKIGILVAIKEADGEVEFPLAHCSDGTVKWLALVATLVTTASGFAIEEPENFLHPNIQKEFVNIVRTESTSIRRNAFTLLTTHSESLLNETTPSELILVWMEDGITKASRLSHSEDVVNEINRTGFGLGYYYTTGSLSVG